MKYIEQSHCEHLDNYSGDLHSCQCKRYVTAINPKNNGSEKLVFCNEWFRLNVQEKCKTNDYYGLHQFVAADLVRDMICKHFGITEYESFNFSNKSMKVGVVLCQRPFIYIHVSIRAAIDWYNLHHSRNLFFAIKDTILDWCNHNERYKKHKTNCDNIKRILNKIKHFLRDDEHEVLLNELFLTILKITTNETH